MSLLLTKFEVESFSSAIDSIRKNDFIFSMNLMERISRYSSFNFQGKFSVFDSGGVVFSSKLYVSDC